MKRGLVLSPGHTRLRGALGFALASKGETEDARKILDELLKLKTQSFVAGECISFVYAGLGDAERMCEYLEIAVRERTISQNLLRYQPVFDKYRKDERFWKILKKANILPA